MSLKNMITWRYIKQPKSGQNMAVQALWLPLKKTIDMLLLAQKNKDNEYSAYKLYSPSFSP